MLALVCVPVSGLLSANAGEFKFPVQMAEMSPFGLWDASLSIRTSGGFNSNPSLAYLEEFRQPAPFFEYGGDLMLIRAPTDNNSVYVFLSGDDRRYFNVEEVPGQQNFLSQFRFEHESPTWWSAGGNLTWMYLNQVLDLSNFDTGVGTAQVTGQTVILRPEFSARLGTNWVLTLEVPLMRQGFSEPADGFFEVGSQLLLTRQLGRDSTVSLGYSWVWRPYDSSPLLTPGGEIIPGTLERLRYNSVNGRWQHFWGRDRQWRTTVFSGFIAARDNGLGYYDYNRYRVGGSVQFRRGRWRVMVEGGVQWYDYIEQTKAPEETDLRERQEYNLGLEMGFEVNRRIRWLVRFTWDDSVANIPQDTYNAKVASTGFEFEF